MAAPDGPSGEVASNTGGNATSLAITLPSGTARKMAIICVDGTATVSWPAGWTELDSQIAETTFAILSVGLSDADTAATSVTPTWSGSQRASAIGWTQDGDVDNISIAKASGADGSPDPPDLTGLTSGDFRIIPVCGWDNGLRTLSTYPETADNLTAIESSNQGTGCGICSIGQTSITSYNPGTFGLSGSTRWATMTIAVPEAAGAGTQALTPSLVSQTMSADNPTVTTGNVDLDPANVQQLLAGVPPDVIAGAVSLALDLVSQLIGTESPSVLTGGATIDPASVSQPLAAINPTIQSLDQFIETALAVQSLAAIDPAIVPGGITVSPALASQLLAAISPATVGDAISYGPFTASDFAALYRYSSLPASGDITQWDDESGNSRHMTADASPGTGVPSVTTLGGEKAADFDDTNLETLEYDEGSEFYTGDIGFIIVAQFDSFVGTSDVIMSAATGGSGTTWKHIFGTTLSGADYVIMSGDGSPGAHINFGTPATGSVFIATVYVRNSGDDDVWIGKTQELDSSDSGGNNLRGWRVGTRETDDRPLDGKIQFLGIIEMDGYGESDLLAARDDVGAELALSGFVAQTVDPTLVSQLAAATEPTITQTAPDQTVDPAAESQLIAGVDPTVVAGATTISVDQVSQLLAAIEPLVQAGDITIAPALESLLLDANEPSLSVLGAVISPESVSSLLAALDPLIAMAIVSILTRSMSRFYRVYRDGVPSLYLVPIGRRIASGWKISEGYHAVSGKFIHNSGEEDDIMASISAIWAANSTASTSALKALINLHLTDIGYRAPGGGNVG